MNEQEMINLLIAFLPLLALQLFLQTFSLYHLYKNSSCNNKQFFALMIIILSFIGIALYWLIGDKYSTRDNTIDDTSEDGVF